MKYELPASQKKRAFLAYGLALLIGCILVLPGLSGSPLFDPWEPEYSQVAREMGSTIGSWLDPTYMGRPFAGKPMLGIWLIRLGQVIAGPNELGSRLFSALSYLSLVLLAIYLGGKLLGRRSGLIAGLVIATSPQVVLLGRQSLLDIPYTLFLTGAVLNFLLGIREPQSWAAPRRFAWFYFLLGLSILTKGASGALAIFASVLLYCAITGKFTLLKRIRLVRGAVILLLVTGPWLAYIGYKHGWAHLFMVLVFSHIEGSVGSGIPGAGKTFELYAKALGFGMFPWSAFLPVAFVRWFTNRAGQGDKDLRVGAIMFLIIALLLAGLYIAPGRMQHYVLPVLVLLALFTGDYIARLGSKSDLKDLPAWTIRLELLLALFMFAIMANDLMTSYRPLAELFTFAKLKYKRFPRGIDPYPYFAVSFLVFGVLLLFATIRRKLGNVNFGAMAVAAGGLILAMNYEVVPAIAPHFSLQPLYLSYKIQAEKGAPVCDRAERPRPSAVFYFGKNIYPATDDMKAVEFLRKGGQRFCLVDKDKFPFFGTAYKHAVKESVFVVEERHPLTLLVSNMSNPKIEKRISEHVLKPGPNGEPVKLPEISHRIGSRGAILEDKIAVLGYDVNPSAVKPGESFTITYYFKCLKEMDADYQVFIHGDDPGEGARLHGDHPPLQGLYPTSRWKPGEIIIDSVTLTVPRHKRPSTYTIRMGFYLGERRLKVINNVSTDGANRINTARVRVLR